MAGLETFALRPPPRPRMSLRSLLPRVCAWTVVAVRVVSIRIIRSICGRILRSARPLMGGLSLRLWRRAPRSMLRKRYWCRDRPRDRDFPVITEDPNGNISGDQLLAGVLTNLYCAPPQFSPISFPIPVARLWRWPSAFSTTAALAVAMPRLPFREPSSFSGGISSIE